MAEELIVDAAASREEKYRTLLPQIDALTTDEPNLVANLANTASALHFGLGFFWVGFYLVDGDELVLGPFQGPIACTRIAHGKGVCGTAWAENRTVLVPDVEQFPGHIACSSDSKSEIVVPIRNKDGNVALILDVDSSELADFSQVDQHYLEQLAQRITTWL